MKTNKMVQFIIISFLGFGLLGSATLTTNTAAQAATTVSYVNYIPGIGLPVYASPNGTKTGQTLKTGSAWVVTDTSYDPKVGTWFKLGDSQWVNADFMVNKSSIVYDNGVALEFNAVVKTTKSTTVYMMPGGYPTKQTLAANRTWKTSHVTTIHDGTTWYNVGLNQWIPASNTVITAR